VDALLPQESEVQFYRDQLWTAPELLRMTTRPVNGTQKADVYSFAIILQEIMFRAAPYFIDIDQPQSTGSSYNFLIDLLTEIAGLESLDTTYCFSACSDE